MLLLLEEINAKSTFYPVLNGLGEKHVVADEASIPTMRLQLPSLVNFPEIQKTS